MEACSNCGFRELPRRHYPTAIDRPDYNHLRYPIPARRAMSDTGYDDDWAVNNVSENPRHRDGYYPGRPHSYRANSDLDYQHGNRCYRCGGIQEFPNDQTPHLNRTFPQQEAFPQRFDGSRPPSTSFNDTEPFYRDPQQRQSPYRHSEEKLLFHGVANLQRTSNNYAERHGQAIETRQQAHFHDHSASYGNHPNFHQFLARRSSFSHGEERAKDVRLSYHNRSASRYNDAPGICRCAVHDSGPTLYREPNNNCMDSRYEGNRFDDYRYAEWNDDPSQRSTAGYQRDVCHKDEAHEAFRRDLDDYCNCEEDDFQRAVRQDPENGYNRRAEHRNDVAVPTHDDGIITRGHRASFAPRDFARLPTERSVDRRRKADWSDVPESQSYPANTGIRRSSFSTNNPDRTAARSTEARSTQQRRSRGFVESHLRARSEDRSGRRERDFSMEDVEQRHGYRPARNPTPYVPQEPHRLYRDGTDAPQRDFTRSSNVQTYHQQGDQGRQIQANPPNTGRYQSPDNERRMASPSAVDSDRFPDRKGYDHPARSDQHGQERHHGRNANRRDEYHQENEERFEYQREELASQATGSSRNYIHSASATNAWSSASRKEAEQWTKASSPYAVDAGYQSLESRSSRERSRDRSEGEHTAKHGSSYRTTSAEQGSSFAEREKRFQRERSSDRRDMRMFPQEPVRGRPPSRETHSWPQQPTRDSERLPETRSKNQDFHGRDQTAADRSKIKETSFPQNPANQNQQERRDTGKLLENRSRTPFPEPKARRPADRSGVTKNISNMTQSVGHLPRNPGNRNPPTDPVSTDKARMSSSKSTLQDLTNDITRLTTSAQDLSTYPTSMPSDIRRRIEEQKRKKMEERRSVVHGGDGEETLLSRIQTELHSKMSDWTSGIDDKYSGVPDFRSVVPETDPDSHLSGRVSNTAMLDSRILMEEDQLIPKFRAAVDVSLFTSPTSVVDVVVDSITHKVVIRAYTDPDEGPMRSLTQKITLPRFADETKLEHSINSDGVLEIEVPLLYYFPPADDYVASQQDRARAYVYEVRQDPSNPNRKIIEIVVDCGQDFCLADLRVDVASGRLLISAEPPPTSPRTYKQGVKAETGRCVIKQYRLPAAADVSAIKARRGDDGRLAILVPVTSSLTQ